MKQCAKGERAAWGEKICCGGRNWGNRFCMKQCAKGEREQPGGRKSAVGGETGGTDSV